MISSPKLSKQFLSWIENNNFVNKTIVEIGSGYSTIFFSSYFKYTYSFEDDFNWFLKIRSLLDQKKIHNVELSMFDKSIIEKKEFIELIKSADVFLIDNNPVNISRSIFAKLIDEYKKNDSIIILDNGMWNMDAYRFLKENYYCIDFPYEREDFTKTETSVFFQKIVFPKNKNNGKRYI